MLKIKNFAASVINSFENSQSSWTNYFLSFFFAIIIRNFAECFSQGKANIFNANATYVLFSVMHYSVYYITIALSLIIIFHYATKSSITTVIKIVLPSFILLIITPIVDVLITFGEGHHINYVLPGENINLIKSYITYFGEHPGISSGMKIEIFIILLASFFYFYVKRANIFISITYTLLIYSVIFLSGLTPVIIQLILSKIGLTYHYTSSLMMNYYAIWILFLGAWILFLYDKQVLKLLFKDLPWLRLLHYQLALLLGVALGIAALNLPLSSIFYLHPDILIDTLFLLISILFAGGFAVICNNIADQDIDIISNPNRALIKGEISLSFYQLIGYWAFSLSLAYSALVSVKALFIMLFVNGSYYIYSVPPLRLKRILILSKLIIASNSLALVLLGYILVQNNIIQFPSLLFLLFIFGFTLSANFVDIKDYKGDTAVGIITLPVLLGLKWSKVLIGVSFFLTYIMFYFFLQQITFLPILATGGILQYYLINKSNYKEWQPLLLCLISIFVLIVYLLL